MHVGAKGPLAPPRTFHRYAQLGNPASLRNALLHRKGFIVKPRIQQLLGATLAVVFVGALSLVGVTSASADQPSGNAPNPPEGKCIVSTIYHPAVDEISHQEFRYSQVITGHDSTSHTEYRYQTRSITYGYIEHKYVEGYNFVDGGNVTINGHTVSGHWVADPGVWHAIPDSIINAVWGSGGIPDNLIGGSEANPKGNVPLSVYGGPNANAPYYAAKELNPSGYTGYGPWSDWSTTPVTSSKTVNVETRSVSDNNGVADKTVYYLTGGGQSNNLTDANWTTETPGSPWTLVDQRKVVTQEAHDAWTEYVYGDCPAVTPAPPVVTVVCGANNDTVTTPGTEYNNDPQVTVTDKFTYIINPHGMDTPGTITVAATPKAGYTVSQPGNGDSYVIEDAGDALWTFTDTNTACAPPKPIVCVLNTGIPAGPEPGDHAAVQGPNGLDFKGASVPAIDWYQRVLSGNAQGITYLSVTYAPGGTGQPAQVVIEVLAPYFVTASDPSGYATLSTNLVAPSGTINLLAPGIGWSSTHIASGAGSLASPESYSNLVDQIGVNSLFSAPSLHLLTKSKSGDSSTVVSLNSSCGNNSYVPTKPKDDVSHTSTTRVDCTSNSQTTITTTTTKPYIWNADSKSYVLDTDSADWKVTTDTPGVTVPLSGEDIATKCPDNVITPTGPSYTESCVITSANTTDAVTMGITYADVLVGNTVTTTATAVAPYVIKFGAQASWSHPFTGGNASGCKPKTLALTGQDWPGAALLGALLAVFVGVWIARRRHGDAAA